MTDSAVDPFDAGASVAPYTREYLYLRGDYDLGDTRMPYFAVSMPISHAITTLNLARDTIFDPTEPVDFEELFQRDLDEQRAVGEIVQYLKQPERTKFFNSLTVVLMPVEGGPRHPRLADDYGLPDDDPPPAPQDNFDEEVLAGPVRLRHRAATPTAGRISWNTDRVRPVVIDGQHRFFAIKELYEDSTYRFHESLGSSDLPLLLLVLDPRVGFEPSEGSARNVKSACRTVFVDLNKNARAVSTARQHLLNDLDVIAVSMREILEFNPGNSAGDVRERATQEHMLPVALVDWQTEKAKFDAGYHATSLLTLYDHVEQVINLPEPKSTDHSAYREYIAKLSAQLNLGVHAPELVNHLQRRLDRHEQELLPFQFHEKEVRQISQTFRRELGGLIALPLVYLNPYREFLDVVDERSGWGGLDERWLSLDERGRKSLEVYYESYDPQPLKDALRTIKDNNALAYQVVFQRGLLRSLSEIEDGGLDVWSYWDLPESEYDRHALITEWCRRVNQRFTGSWRQDCRAWISTGLHDDLRIDFRQGSIPEIAAFIGYVVLATEDEWQAWLGSAAAEGAESESLDHELRSWIKDRWALVKRGQKSNDVNALWSTFGKDWQRGAERVVKRRAKAQNETIGDQALRNRTYKQASSQIRSLLGAVLQKQ
jgi:hypothetical protein